MSIISKRLVSIAASTALISLVSASANAQTDVILGGTLTKISTDATSTYKFTDSMILNSIGFFTDGKTYESLSYSVGGTTYRLGTDFTANDLSVVDNGVQWLNITPQSMVSNETVTVYTKGPATPIAPSFMKMFVYDTNILQNFTVSPSANVSYEGLVAGAFGPQPKSGYANSNLRVSASNPGSNVAPEPGSFALALTGGAVLLGICVRRRRLAG